MQIMKYLTDLTLRLSVVIVITIIGLTVPAYGQDIDKIIAKVDNYIILKSEVENGYIDYITSNGYAGEEAKCSILEQLIVNKVLVAKAELDSILVDDSAVKGELERRMQHYIRLAGSREKLEKNIETSVEEFQEEVRDQVREQMLAQKMQSEILQSVTVTPKEVKKYFSSIPKDSVPFISRELKVGQIVKKAIISEKEKDKIKAKLLDLKRQIKEGADFDKLARNHSQDYASASKGGDLGWNGRGDLVPEFESVALQISEGEIADPIESDFGFHLIQLLERRGNRYRARHILMRPQPTEQDINRTIEFLDSIRNELVKGNLKFNQVVKEHSDDRITRQNAGFFKNQFTNTNYVSSKQLDPILYLQVDTMSVNTFSKPMKYRDEEGNDGARIIYLAGQIPAHYANIEVDYQKFYMATLNRKKAEILEEWLSNAISDIFIDIDDDYKDCNILEGKIN